jgi:hypothetical protein
MTTWQAKKTKGRALAGTAFILKKTILVHFDLFGLGTLFLRHGHA